MFALNLSDDGRVLSATLPKYARPGAITVVTLPDGDISDHRYIDGEYVYDPLPEEETTTAPTQLDRIEAQTMYTALMTDTLLEDDE